MSKNSNKQIAIVLMIVAVLYLIGSFRLPPYAYVPVDSNVVPIALGVILLVLSITLYFNKAEHVGEKKALPKNEILTLFTVLLFILLYIFLLEFVGFILVTALFIFFCSWFLGYKRFVPNLIVALAVPFFIYFLFGSFLQIQLPQGILPF